ncbi:YbbR-like domain-containing protein [Entomospira nematocerorum]|uniref:YbbR-like domain-containing protein n=1 Tax=Entomospira nematocerorum TaxID=2719987 RepID=A0A968GE98_9SPIO|nr:YbbR-like domain-containing protein [Entomospira nematocera]NIZ46690.1 YbbR-like domain-containing protein [Entomospira nematocera]WDI33513.1 YbbR-like domain-containing protein [Entomospira nematocera]
MNSTTESISKFFARNLFAKISSIMLAALFFFMYRHLSFEQVTFYLPVQIYLPEDVAILSQDISTSQVTIRGSKTDLAQFDRRHLFLEVHIDNFLEGTRYHRISLNRSAYNNRLSQFSISLDPASVQLTMEPIIVKQIMIEPVLLGQPARGYLQSDIQLTPSTVEAKGPRSILETIHSIRTYPLDISNIKKSIEEDIALNFNHQKVSITPTQSHIYVSVATQYLYRHRFQIPITVLNLHESLFIENIDDLIGFVMIESRINHLATLDDAKWTLILNLQHIKDAGEYNLKPQLRNLELSPDDYNIIVENTTIKIKEIKNYE